MPSNSTDTRVKQAFFWLLLIIFVFVLPIGLAEAYLRHIGLGNPLIYYTDPVYGYALQPNQQQVRLRGARITIDSAGLRSPRDWAEPADAKILFIGDSVTYGGSYIDDSETFSQGVCARLDMQLARKMTCGNAGINAYGTDNMAGRIRSKSFNDESAVVVILIAGDALRGLTPVTSGPFATQATRLPVKGLYEAVSYAAWRVSIRMDPPKLPSPAEEGGIARKSVENLVAALHETYGDGRKVLIVFSPAKSDLNGMEPELVKTVRDVLDHSGFEVLDLHAPVSEAVKDGFYYDNVHLDIVGHSFYADRIAERLATYFQHRLSNK